MMTGIQQQQWQDNAMIKQTAHMGSIGEASFLPTVVAAAGTMQKKKPLPQTPSTNELSPANRKFKALSLPPIDTNVQQQQQQQQHQPSFMAQNLYTHENNFYSHGHSNTHGMLLTEAHPYASMSMTTDSGYYNQSSISYGYQQQYMLQQQQPQQPSTYPSDMSYSNYCHPPSIQASHPHPQPPPPPPPPLPHATVKSTDNTITVQSQSGGIIVDNSKQWKASTQATKSNNSERVRRSDSLKIESSALTFSETTRKGSRRSELSTPLQTLFEKPHEASTTQDSSTITTSTLSFQQQQQQAACTRRSAKAVVTRKTSKEAVETIKITDNQICTTPKATKNPELTEEVYATIAQTFLSCNTTSVDAETESPVTAVNHGNSTGNSSGGSSRSSNSSSPSTPPHSLPQQPENSDDTTNSHYTKKTRNTIAIPFLLSPLNELNNNSSEDGGEERDFSQLFFASENYFQQPTSASPFSTPRILSPWGTATSKRSLSNGGGFPYHNHHHVSTGSVPTLSVVTAQAPDEASLKQPISATATATVAVPAVFTTNTQVDNNTSCQHAVQNQQGKDIPKLSSHNQQRGGGSSIIASYSLVNIRSNIKLYRRMVHKTHNSSIQMAYAKYLVQIAQLFDVAGSCSCSSHYQERTGKPYRGGRVGGVGGVGHRCRRPFPQSMSSSSLFYDTQSSLSSSSIAHRRFSEKKTNEQSSHHHPHYYHHQRKGRLMTKSNNNNNNNNNSSSKTLTTNTKSPYEIRHRLLTEAQYWIRRLARAGESEALFIQGRWYLLGGPDAATIDAFALAATTTVAATATAAAAATTAAGNESSTLFFELEHRGRRHQQQQQQQLIKNEEKSFQCFLKASRGGWIEAHYALAQLWKRKGRYDRAIDCYEKGAKADHTPSIYKMAKIYLRGQLGKEKDIQKGMDYLKQAADREDIASAEPAFVLGCIYAHEYDRIGIQRSIREDPAAESYISERLAEEDVDEEHSTDKRLALKYLKKSADFGYADAIYFMGQVYETGMLGQPCNVWQAFQYYTKAADDGEHPGAMLDLARLYRQGVPNSCDSNDMTTLPLSASTNAQQPQQRQLAFKWCKRSADLGFDQAEYVLGTYYEEGVGVDRDFAKALEYYSKAASKGYQHAAEKLNYPMLQGANRVKHVSRCDSGGAFKKSFSMVELGAKASQKATRPDGPVTVESTLPSSSFDNSNKKMLKRNASSRKKSSICTIQ